MPSFCLIRIQGKVANRKEKSDEEERGLNCSLCTRKVEISNSDSFFIHVVRLEKFNSPRRELRVIHMLQ